MQVLNNSFLFFRHVSNWRNVVFGSHSDALVYTKCNHAVTTFRGHYPSGGGWKRNKGMSRAAIFVTSPCKRKRYHTAISNRWIVRFFCEYGKVAFPNPSNIEQIVSQIAHTELVTKQFACIHKLKEGMGSFWNGVSAEEIKVIYSCCSPTFTNKPSCLYFP